MNRLPTVGLVHAFDRTLTLGDMNHFAELTGDVNPLHRDPATALRFGFENVVVYGLLAGSLFSRLIGTHPAWKHPLYLDQTFRFRQPIFPGDSLTVRGTVVGVSEAISVVTLNTEIIRNAHIVIDGEAHVKILSDVV